MSEASTEPQQVVRGGGTLIDVKGVRIPLGRRRPGGRLTVVAIGGGSVDLSAAREARVTVLSLLGRTRITPPAGAKLSQAALLGRTCDRRPASGRAPVHVRAVALLGAVAYA